MQISSPELYKLSCPNFILLLLVVRSHFCILPLFFNKKKRKEGRNFYHSFSCRAKVAFVRLHVS